MRPGITVVGPVPLMDPYYLGAGYPIQYWNIFTVDRQNKTFHDDVMAAFKELFPAGGVKKVKKEAKEAGV